MVIIEKICFKCEKLKSIDNFHKHPQMKDGHLNKCAECVRTYVKQHRRDNESVRQYDRERYRMDPSRKFKQRENTIDWRLANPLGYAAHNAVKNAVRSGRLQKQPCKICGDTEKVHAHHADYNKPLDVEWYCPRHHSKVHNPENL